MSLRRVGDFDVNGFTVFVFLPRRLPEDGVAGLVRDQLQPGQFIGSISYVTGETAPANIVSLEPTRYVSWSKAALKEFMAKNPDLHSALKTTLAIDLTKWLKATWTREAT